MPLENKNFTTTIFHILLQNTIFISNILALLNIILMHWNNWTVDINQITCGQMHTSYNQSLIKLLQKQNAWTKKKKHNYV